MWRTHFEIYKKVAVICALAAGILLLPAAGRSTDERMYSVYANVEQDGKLVTGLDPSHFRVFLDNRAQTFDLESPEMPISVVLLVEYSQQTWRYLTDIQNAIEGFVENAPEGNWYALVTFDHDTNVVVDFTKEARRISSAFSELGQPFWNETDTFDAISNVLDMTSRLPGRRVIVFVGAGIDSFSRHSFGDVEKAVESTNVTVYALGAGSAYRGYYDLYLSTSARMDLLQAQAFLNMVADRSGGEAWFPNMDIGFRDAMKGVMQDLSTQYKIVLKDVPSDGRQHKLKVEAFTVVNDKRKDFKVRVRDSIRLPLT